MGNNRYPRSGDIIKSDKLTFRVVASDLALKRAHCALGGSFNWDRLSWNGDGYEWDLKPLDIPDSPCKASA